MSEPKCVTHHKACETWRPIPGYDGLYEVSDNGKVRSWRVQGSKVRKAERPRFLRQRPRSGSGYPVVDLWYHGNGRQEYVHRLVLEAFRGPPPEGAVTRHLNGDRADNRLSNLKWGTERENEQDKIRHGTQARGSRHGMSKLAERDVRAIRRFASGGGTGREIAARFGVHETTVHDILRGRRWAWLDNDGA